MDRKLVDTRTRLLSFSSYLSIRKRSQKNKNIRKFSDILIDKLIQI